MNARERLFLSQFPELVQLKERVRLNRVGLGMLHMEVEKLDGWSTMGFQLRCVLGDLRFLNSQILLTSGRNERAIV